MSICGESTTSDTVKNETPTRKKAIADWLFRVLQYARKWSHIPRLCATSIHSLWHFGCFIVLSFRIQWQHTGHSFWRALTRPEVIETDAVTHIAGKVQEPKEMWPNECRVQSDRIEKATPTNRWRHRSERWIIELWAWKALNFIDLYHFTIPQPPSPPPRSTSKYAFHPADAFDHESINWSDRMARMAFSFNRIQLLQLSCIKLLLMSQMSSY